jgi:ABC-2 type transport system permease protein
VSAISQYVAVVRKEARQTLRDRRIMFMLVAAPMIQLVVFGAAVDFDVDRVPTVIADLDQTATSRDHVRRLLADGTLRELAIARGGAVVDEFLDQDRTAAALVVPPSFGADLAGGRTARAQVVIDGTDPTRAAAAGSAASRFFTEEAEKRLRKRRAASGPQVIPRVLYNPTLATAAFVVPGIVALLLVVVTTITSAMGLAREREMGTLEQVLVTPIPPFVLLAGKMTPFVVIGMFDVLLALTAMSWIFAVPIHGPLLLLAAGSALYLCSTLGVGLLVSTLSSTQQQAFLGAFLFVIPAVLLSGIMTPIRAMPAWLQTATLANPLRWFAELVRGVLVRGAGFGDLWLHLVALTLFGTVIVGVATVRFRRGMG